MRTFGEKFVSFWDCCWSTDSRKSYTSVERIITMQIFEARYLKTLALTLFFVPF